MSLTSYDTANAADAPTTAVLRSVLASNLPGLKVSMGTAVDGQEWVTITYPMGEFLMHRNAAGVWHANDNAPSQASGIGATPADALMDVLTDC